MNIGINISVLKKGEQLSGIGNYSYQVLKELMKSDSENEYFLFCNDDLCVGFEERKNFNIIIIRNKSRMLWSRYLLGFYIKKYHLDVLWSPTHNLPFYGPVNVRYYITVHDIANQIFDDIAGYSKFSKAYYGIVLKKSCKKASIVIADSEATKGDLIEYLGIDEEKIKVIYLGGPNENDKIHNGSNIIEKYKITEPYFLYLGRLQPRKNISVIVDSFIKLKEEYNTTAKLVLAGGVGWGMEQTVETIKNSVFNKDIIMTGYISDEDKYALYKGALTFVFPSVYEGFGLPVLESFSYGVPVITANNSSLPEVGGDAAFYIEDCYNVTDLEKQMYKMLSLSSDERERIKAKEYSQLMKFSWKKCAKEILHVFEHR
jgi:glycosyltransferase involved in cell wall biosynthesis